MKRLVLPLAALLLGCISSPAHAQVPLGSRPTTPFARPAISPLIGMFSGGASPGLNYLSMVRPQLEMQSSLQQLQMAQAAQYTDNPALATKGILDTGHSSRFLSYQQYFMTVGRPGSSTGGTTGVTTPPMYGQQGIGRR